MKENKNSWPQMEGGGVNKLHFLIAELIIQNDRLIIFLIFKKSRLKLLVNKSLFINLRI